MSTIRSLQLPGFQVLGLIGSGARSTIWQIRDDANERVYALKRVVKRHSSDARFLEQAVNEYTVGVRFNHPSIRRMCRITRIRRWLRLREIHLIMEFCEGNTIQERRPRSMDKVVRIFSEVASAMAHMNSKGYLHADIKPNNIVVASDGTIKIIDLGQSCPIGTVKQRIQGTPDFIAPEQVRRLPLDARTDVFNFGASLYWTLVGKPIPTILPKKKDTVTFIADLSPISPELVNPRVPSSLSELVADCIQLKPSQRPKTMHEVASRLSLVARTLNQNNNRGKKRSQ